MPDVFRRVFLLITVFTVLGLPGCSREIEVTPGPAIKLNQEQLERLVRLGSAGNGEACWCLSLYYSDDGEKELRWLREGVKYGDADAQFSMYGYLSISEYPLLTSEAFGLLRRAAEQGHPSAQWILGDHYLKGESVPRDADMAAHWYYKSAMQGNEAAILKLITFLTQGHEDRDRLVEAYSWSVVALSRIRPYSGYLKAFQEQQEKIAARAKELGYDVRALHRLAKSKAMRITKSLRPWKYGLSPYERCTGDPGGS